MSDLDRAVGRLEGVVGELSKQVDMLAGTVEPLKSFRWKTIGISVGLSIAGSTLVSVVLIGVQVWRAGHP